VQILLVEDVQDNRELFRIMLEQLGHTVLEAENGRQAVHAAIAHQPDCILMDLSLPEVDGLLATAAVRKISFKKHSYRCNNCVSKGSGPR